jgi:hypothetical protein
VSSLASLTRVWLQKKKRCGDGECSGQQPKPTKEKGVEDHADLNVTEDQDDKEK